MYVSGLAFSTTRARAAWTSSIPIFERSEPTFSEPSSDPNLEDRTSSDPRTYQNQWLKIDHICNHADIALPAAIFGNLKQVFQKSSEWNTNNLSYA